MEISIKYICPGCGYEARVPGACPRCKKPLVASCPTCGNPVVGEIIRPQNEEYIRVTR